MPHRFDFFQAIRLLEWANHETAEHEPRRRRYPVGYDRPAEKEIVYFRAIPSLQFPATQISRWVWRTLADGRELPPEMIITFMGLTGPSGVLPAHYTRELLNRIHTKDYVLRDFLDLFNHRTVSFYYRAWEKYRVYIGYEKARRERQKEDPFSQVLRSLAGIGSANATKKWHINDDHLLFYAGLLHHRSRNVTSLAAMLSDYFEVPIRIKQLISEKMALSLEQQTRLPHANEPQGNHCQLSKTALLGSHITQSQHRFRVVVGPLNYTQFKRFLLEGRTRLALRDMVRLYVGSQFSFDVQLVLQKQEQAICRLYTPSDPEPSHLSWDIWLGRRAEQNLDDLILRL
jgi:type VI secretion system protein ImpH